MKTVSVVMCTYNGEKYLREQLDSLIHQTLQPTEVILQDDGSSDHTIEIAHSYCDKLNLKIYRNETNLGFSKNFESAISKATGDLIALCDQDDIWEKNKLELLANALGKASLIYSDSLLVDSNNASLNLLFSNRLKRHFGPSNTALNFLFSNVVAGHAMLFQKELVEDIIPFPNEIYFDTWIAATAASKEGIVYLPIPLVRYRQHSSNTLANQKKQKKSLLEKIQNMTHKRINDNQNFLIRMEAFRNISTLTQEEKNLLHQIHKYATDFKTTWFNWQFFIFLTKNREIFFKFFKKNKVRLSFKHSLGLKLFKKAVFS